MITQTRLIVGTVPQEIMNDVEKNCKEMQDDGVHVDVHMSHTNESMCVLLIGREKDDGK